MHCKFLSHGVVIQYDQIIKPCCEWQADDQWNKEFSLQRVDLSAFHDHDMIKKYRHELSLGHWPDPCKKCKAVEGTGRVDSTRGCGNSAYQALDNDDIVLEIRPGSTCNFACQTCWPEASSRVMHFYRQAGIAHSFDPVAIKDFGFLLSVKHRIKKIVLLGGEPFYDTDCRRFLSWAHENLSADILMFTNGSGLDWTWIKNYQKHITLLFSLDAVGPAAEYIRFGTDWNQIKTNIDQVKTHEHVTVRVNVTVSALNLFYLRELMEFLLVDWPAVVSFGLATEPLFKISNVPNSHRNTIIENLKPIVKQISNSTIPNDQKINACKFFLSLIQDLAQENFDVQNYQQLCKHMIKMDHVKKIKMAEYCPELSDMLSQQFS